MSLDVYLSGEPDERPCICRDCGNEHIDHFRADLYSSNITHNLGRMAEEAGIYKHLWRPEEIGIVKASQLIAPLREGLELLRSDPKRFEAFNASNGWGMYKHFVPFVSKYLQACEDYPDAEVTVSR